MQSINVIPSIPRGPGIVASFIEQDQAVAQANYIITGTTRDSNGNPLGGCTTEIFRTIDNVMVAQAISDSNGLFIRPVADNVTQFYLVAYLAGSPDVTGASVNTLTGSQV